MDHVEPAVAAPASASIRGAAEMPRTALLFRWLVGISGLIPLLALTPSLAITRPAELLVLLVASIVSELYLTVELSQWRYVSLTATITLMAFLWLGAAGAAVISVGALVIAQIIASLTGKIPGRPGLIFFIFNAGQYALSGLAAGLVTVGLTGSGLTAPPLGWRQHLLVFAITYIVANIALTTIATALRYGMREVREQLWPNVTAWTVLNFTIAIPLALMGAALASQTGTFEAVLLTLTTLAALSCIIRLASRYDRANQELTVLNEMGASLTAALDFGTLLPAIYHGTAKLMDVDAFSIALVDDERRDIRFVYGVEGGVEIAPRSLPYGRGPVSRVLTTRQPLAVGQLDSLDTTQLRSGRTGSQPQSALIVPLQAGERLIGAISAQSYQPRAYTPRQLELLVAIARISAMAIHNTQLFEREKTLIREREEFVSLVAHELRNPLAALSGFNQIAMRRLRDDDDEVRRPLQVIAEQATRLNRLVEDLLDLSRADSGRLSLSCEMIDLGALVQEVCDQPQLQTPTHRLRLTVADGLPPISADPMRICQVLNNLISNAIKYSPDGGQIDIRASVWDGHDPRWPSHIRHTVAAHGCWIVVEVQDQGIGIAPADLPRVFARFFRAISAAERSIEGLGLGLSICEELVRAHGGVIWASSEPGEGSTFCFALPALRP